jgi:hypothetical protein
MFSKRDWARQTWVEQVGPWSLYTRARAICEDGKPRIVRLAQTADSFFSVPARLSYQGKTVSGFITWKSADGLSTNPEQWVAFVATGKHKGIFAPAQGVDHVAQS